jgi:S-formylglutathione hydrolase FrmB
VVRTGLVAELDRWIAAGGTPFVFAAPDGNSGVRPDTEWADSADGADPLESGLLDAVRPAVEGSHPRAASVRALAGVSMGGYGALNIGLHHPELFGSLVSMSGYFHVDDPDGVFGDDPAWKDHNSPDRHVAAARRIRILLAEATSEDGLVEGEADRMAALLRAAGAEVRTAVLAGNHGFGALTAHPDVLLDFLAAGWPTHRRAP